MADNGLDFEQLLATGLFSTGSSGRLEIEIVIRVTDPDGNFNDFTRTILVSDVAENLVTGGTTESDFIEGTTLADIISGGDDDDFLFGKAGDDIISGQLGDDILAGNAGNDLLRGGGGVDIIKGGADDDRIWGGNHDDFLFGGGGDDKIEGGKGDDLLKDGLGRDRLTGNQGDDIFVIAADNEKDMILDFEDGKDLIRMDGVNDFADLSISTLSPGKVLIRNGADRLVVFDTGGVLTASDLTVDDFIL